MRLATIDECVAERDSYARSPTAGDEGDWVKKAEKAALCAVDDLRPVPPPFDVLSSPLARRVTERWSEPCEAAFEFLMREDPRALAQLIERQQLAAADLTFAAEILGHADDHALVRKVLSPLLSHPEAVVREGAIYGLANHLDSVTRALVKQRAESDPSHAVRTVAQDAIE